MAVLLGVYKVINSVIFIKGDRNAVSFNMQNDLTELIKNTENITRKQEKIKYFYENNYITIEEANELY